MDVEENSQAEDVQKNKHTRIHMWIALATLLLTPIFSGIVVNYQLSKGHDFWTRQQAFERSETEYDRRLKLMEDLNSRLLRLEVSAKEIKIDLSFVTAQLALQARKSNNHDTSGDIKRLYHKMVQYHYDLNSFASKTQMAVLYFSEDVVHAVEGLRLNLQKNFSNGSRPYEELMGFLAKGDDANLLEFVTRITSKSRFETPVQLTQARIKLLALMIKDLRRFYPNYVPNGR